MAFDQVRIAFPLNILRMNGRNLTQFCMHFEIDKIRFHDYLEGATAIGVLHGNDETSPGTS